MYAYEVRKFSYPGATTGWAGGPALFALKQLDAFNMNTNVNTMSRKGPPRTYFTEDWVGNRAHLEAVTLYLLGTEPRCSGRS
jgi:hypothetical protein